MQASKGLQVKRHEYRPYHYWMAAIVGLSVLAAHMVLCCATLCGEGRPESV
jgi:uncharacterized membrane-anchored protein